MNPVYIEDAKMPKNCKDCCCLSDDYFFHCGVSSLISVSYHSIPDKCPLRPLSEAPREECEIKAIYKIEKETESRCTDCDQDCGNCKHYDSPFYTYDKEVFDYYECQACKYKYGFLESPVNYCQSCGGKIKAQVAQ